MLVTIFSHIVRHLYGYRYEPLNPIVMSEEEIIRELKYIKYNLWVYAIIIISELGFIIGRLS